MGADMMIKAVGQSILSVNMKLIGMFKSGQVKSLDHVLDLLD